MLTTNISLGAVAQDFKNASLRLRWAAFALAVATIAIPAFLSEYDYSTSQLVLAMVLLDICLYPTFRYLVRKETGLPIMPVLCLSFAVQYASPIFTQDAKIEVKGGESFYLENEAVIAALIITIIGVILLQFTYYLIRDGRLTQKLPSVRLNLSRARAEIFCVSIFIFSLFASRIQSMLSQETALQFQSLFNLIQSQLIVAIVILSWLVFVEPKYKRQTVMLYCLVGFAASRGVSTTMLETMILPFAVLFISKWTFTKKLPAVSLTLIAIAFLFFSPVKMDIRKVALDEAKFGQSSSVSDRTSDWVTQASDFWWDALSGRRSLGESATSASSRTDMIHALAHIHTLTPSVVPFQEGTTYKYFAVAFIPRMFWPDKPLGNYANNFYAIEYGISTEEGIATTSFGVTLLGEGYVNFGAAGSLLIMVFLGLSLAGFERLFGSTKAGVGGQAIFLTTFVYFLNGIGSSTEIMFGGILQNLIAGSVLLWFFKKSTFGRPLSQPTLHPVPYRALKS